MDKHRRKVYYCCCSIAVLTLLITALIVIKIPLMKFTHLMVYADEVDASSDEKIVEGESESESETKAIQPFILYLSGVDTRDAELVNSNGDVNILMAVNPQTRNVLLLNTPRDYYLQNPAGGSAMDKLTHCAAYGVENSAKALEQLYDCKVDYYLQINFTGFEKLIDVMGGITVYSDEEFDEYVEDGSIFHVVEGENYMNGMQALAFARDRYHVAYGDNGRGRDQMRVIKALIDMITGNPLNTLKLLPTLLREMNGTFKTDMSVSAMSLLLMTELSGGESDWNVQHYAVTGHNGVDKTYSMAEPTNVMYQDEKLVKHAADLLDLTMDGAELTDEIVGETVQEW